MSFTFKRGIHPNEQKSFTENIPIKVMYPNAKLEMVYPLSQHIGAPCKPIVEVGQNVLLGEKIADSDAFICAPIHASVSGTVKAIRPHLTVSGSVVESVVIENDGKFTEHESLLRKLDYESMSKEEILKVVREAGIVGLGGAGFPTHAKLSPPPDKKIDRIIINGCECEPYLTTDNRVMIEEADRLVIGCRILLRLVDDARVLIGIEDNKPEAIQAVRKAAEGVDRVEVRVLKTKYPQGSEKQLIVALTKREVPSGGLPSDIGCIVQNIDTVIAIHRAIVRGRPLMRKVVTLTGGAIRNPGNYKIRLGTKVSDIIDMIGGFTCTPAKVIVGGPMMGTAIFDIDVPVVKTTAGMLFLTEDEARVPPEEPCIHCARCVEHCPIGLLPLELNADVLADRNEAFVKHNGIDCIECGCCSYVCPSKRRLAQSIRMARRLELAKRRKK